MGACTIPVVLVLSALALFWTYLVILVVPQRWRWYRAQTVVFKAFLNTLLAAIATSVVFTLAVSILKVTV